MSAKKERAVIQLQRALDLAEKNKLSPASTKKFLVDSLRNEGWDVTPDNISEIARLLGFGKELRGRV